MDLIAYPANWLQPADGPEEPSERDWAIWVEDLREMLAAAANPHDDAYEMAVDYLGDCHEGMDFAYLADLAQELVARAES